MCSKGAEALLPSPYRWPSLWNKDDWRPLNCWPSYFQKEKFGGNSFSEFQDEFSCLKSILRWENIFHPLFIRRQRLEESSFCPCLPPRQLFSRQNGLNISPLRKTVIMVDVMLMIKRKWLKWFIDKRISGPRVFFEIIFHRCWRL